MCRVGVGIRRKAGLYNRRPNSLIADYYSVPREAHSQALGLLPISGVSTRHQMFANLIRGRWVTDMFD